MMLQGSGTEAVDLGSFPWLSAVAHVVASIGVVMSLYFTYRAQRVQDQRRREDTEREQGRWEDQARREKRRDHLHVAQLKRERLVSNYPKWAAAMGVYVVQRGGFLQNQQWEEQARQAFLSGGAGESARQASDYHLDRAERHKTLELEANHAMQAAALAIRWDDGVGFAAEVREVTQAAMAWHMTGKIEGGTEIAARALQLVEDRLWSLRKST